MKKGIITIATLFLAGALLLAAYGLSYFHQMKFSTSSSLLSIGKAASQYDSASDAYAQLMQNEGVNVTLSASGVTFAFNTTKIMNYSADAKRLGDFLAANSEINLTIDASEAKRPKVYLDPQNIVADHSPGRLSITPQNSAQSYGNITGYTVLISAGQATPGFYWQNLSAVSPGADAITFNVTFAGSNGTVSAQQSVNRSRYSELRLLDNLNQSLLTLQVNPVSSLAINYRVPFDSQITASLLMNESASARLGTSIINVSGDVQLVGPVILG